MSLGNEPHATGPRVPEQLRRSVVADLVRQWARASHARALINARRAATAATAAHVERAEVDQWLSGHEEESPAEPRTPTP